MSVRTRGDDEIYRVTRKDDGHWVWCDLYGNDGGDNIDLVREIEPDTGYSEAVFRLFSAPTLSLQPRARPVVPVRRPPKLPRQSQEACVRGREYLQGRGISSATIEYAERVGMVRYADNSVLFVGSDQSGAVQSVTCRATDPSVRVQKRDFLGTDKSYPPILPGEPDTVWIVEGGLDALALQDMARRRSKAPPTVIVSGGANVRSFLEREEVQAILRRAERVTIAGENESRPEVQARTDMGHQKQAQRVAEITGREAQRWTPKAEDGKDLADLNYRLVTSRESVERREISQESSGSAGPSLSR